MSLMVTEVTFYKTAVCTVPDGIGSVLEVTGHDSAGCLRSVSAPWCPPGYAVALRVQRGLPPARPALSPGGEPSAGGGRADGPHQRGPDRNPAIVSALNLRQKKLCLATG